MQRDLDKKKNIQYCFNRSAQNYEQAAIIQKKAFNKLLTLLDSYPNETIIDLGCGTGHGTEIIAKKHSEAHVIGVDFSKNMLNIALASKQHATFVNADFDKLPFNSETIDNIFSNMALQWSLNLTDTFSEWNRILKRSGKLVVCTLVDDSLYEVKNCWQQIADSPSINYFHPAATIKNELLEQGFDIEHMIVEKQKIYFDDLLSLLYNFKKVGANFSFSSNNPGKLTKNRLTQIAAYYERYRVNGQLPLTYDLCYILATIAKPKK